MSHYISKFQIMLKLMFKLFSTISTTPTFLIAIPSASAWRGMGTANRSPVPLPNPLAASTIRAASRGPPTRRGAGRPLSLLKKSGKGAPSSPTTLTGTPVFENWKKNSVIKLKSNKNVFNNYYYSFHTYIFMYMDIY